MVEEDGIELSDATELNYHGSTMPFSDPDFTSDNIEAAIKEIRASSPTITQYYISSSVPFSTSIRNDYEAITGFSLTSIVAGKYAFIFSASVFYTTVPKAHYWALYKNGIIVSDSKRQQDTAHSNQTMVDTTTGLIDCDDNDVVDIRYKCNDTGTITVNERTLIAIRVGD